MLRLKDTLDASPLTRNRWKPAFGYMAQLGKASITFLSADAQANVVGATAGLLLEIDEAQDVDPDKYDREFRPMASSTNATTVLYGTAWSEDSLLQRQREINLAHERRTGERLHYEFDWRTLAAVNAPYRAFVEGEISRLGSDHPSISTQYWLRCLSDSGRLFSATQRAALEGTHQRRPAPVAGSTYVAGIDLAGEDEQAEDARARALVPKRDSTVVTIAEVARDEHGAPSLRVVEHVWWTGRAQVWQYERLLELWDRWGFAVCVGRRLRHRRRHRLLPRGSPPRPGRELRLHGAIQEQAGLHHAGDGEHRQADPVCVRRISRVARVLVGNPCLPLLAALARTDGVGCSSVGGTRRLRGQPGPVLSGRRGHGAATGQRPHPRPIGPRGRVVGPRRPTAWRSASLSRSGSRWESRLPWQSPAQPLASRWGSRVAR